MKHRLVILTLLLFLDIFSKNLERIERLFNIFSLIFILLYFTLSKGYINGFLIYRVFSFLFFYSKITNLLYLFFLYEGSILLIIITVYETSISEHKKWALQEIMFWLLYLGSRFLIGILALSSLEKSSIFVIIIIIIPLILKRPIFLRRNWLIILHRQATLLGRIFLAAVILKIPIKFFYFFHTSFFYLPTFKTCCYLIFFSIAFLFIRPFIIKQLIHMKIIIAYIRVIHIFPPLILLAFSLNYHLIFIIFFLIVAHSLARSSIFILVTYAKRRSGTYRKKLINIMHHNMFALFINIILLALNLGIPLNIVGNYEILFIKSFSILSIFRIIIIIILVWSYALRSIEFYKPIGIKENSVTYIDSAWKYKNIIFTSILLCWLPLWLS